MRINVYGSLLFKIHDCFAGRVQAGECYHLYTAHHWSQFSDYQLPEMLRTRLEELCLQIKVCHKH